MSIHRSLATQGRLIRHRNVLTRAERLQRLIEEDRWKNGASPFGLVKVRSIKHKVKKAKKQAEAAATTAGAPTTDAKPAAGAKPSAGAKAPAAPAVKPAAKK